MYKKEVEDQNKRKNKKMCKTVQIKQVISPS